jgi:hypothetical protein
MCTETLKVANLPYIPPTYNKTYSGGSWNGPNHSSAFYNTYEKA